MSDGQISSLRRANRDPMTGPGFHECLIRASNDRLLTERHLGEVLTQTSDYFVDFDNQDFEMALVTSERGDRSISEDRSFDQWRGLAVYGISLSPLELIARVVENDLPYTEILTAD